MIIFIFLSLCGLAWLGLHLVAAPPEPWQTSYARALSRPRWAKDMPVGMPTDFVSWSNISSEVWDLDVAPSIALAVASLSLRTVMAEHELIGGSTPLEKTACCIYYAHKLAGVVITPEECVAAAMHVFFYPGFDVNPVQVASDFVATRRELFSRAAPTGLQKIHLQIQEHFAIHLKPLPLVAPSHSMPKASNGTEAFRKDL